MQKNDKKVASHTTRPKSYDWNRIREEYISSEISLRDLAKKYGVNPSTVMRKNKKEDWQSKRKQIATKTVEKTVEQISDARADINTKAMECVQIIMDKALEGAKTVEMDSKSLKDYVSILKDLKDIGAIAIEAQSNDIVISFADGEGDLYGS